MGTTLATAAPDGGEGGGTVDRERQENAQAHGGERQARGEGHEDGEDDDRPEQPSEQWHRVFDWKYTGEADGLAIRDAFAEAKGQSVSTSGFQTKDRLNE
jgi:hypothetical protein